MQMLHYFYSWQGYNNELDGIVLELVYNYSVQAIDHTIPVEVLLYIIAYLFSSTYAGLIILFQLHFSTPNVDELMEMLKKELPVISLSEICWFQFVLLFELFVLLFCHISEFEIFYFTR